MKKTRKWLIHALFECKDCSVTFDHWVDAQKLAYKHSKKYNHVVTGEVAYAVRYNE